MPLESRFPDFLTQDADTVARLLLGCFLVRDFTDGGRAVVKIVETEAYDQLDAASHSFAGPSPRNRVMFGPSGHLYVYLSYGIHHCANIVCGPAGFGAGVLLRAVEPIEGLDLIRQRRAGVKDKDLTRGPGRLTRALGIDFGLLDHDLTTSPLRLVVGESPADKYITATTRIGISKEKDRPRRFYVASSKFVSKR